MEAAIEIKQDSSARHKVPKRDQMLKYAGEIERMVFAATVLCGKSGNIDCRGHIPKCPFKTKVETDSYCLLTVLEETIGDPL